MTFVDMAQAHLYILNNMEVVQPYLEEHKKILKTMHPRKSDRQIANDQNKTFIKWFKERVDQESDASEILKWLAWGPSSTVITWSGYDINGYSFYTRAEDEKSTMQNSGVMVVAESMHYSSAKDKNPITASMAYYGVIEEIWAMNYKVEEIVLFKCKWVNNNSVVKDEKFGFVSVDLQRLGYSFEPFILGRHAKQVFYVTDPAQPNMSFVLQSKKQKDVGDMSFNLDDDMPPSIASANNPLTLTNVDLLLDDDNDEYHVRIDHSEGIWENM